jgi:hypothetical protein
MLIVNFFAGPGAGKSTMTARVFTMLKDKGVCVEQALEFAKELTWQKRHAEMRCQPHLFGEQLWRLESLRDTGVEVVLTDSPLLLQTAYNTSCVPEFNALAAAIHRSHSTLNFFIERVKPYDPRGRRQSQQSAIDMDRKIWNVLAEFGVEFETVTGDKAGAGIVQHLVLKRIGA